MAFGITAFAESPFSALSQQNINVDVTGAELTSVVNSVGIEAAGNISVPVFDSPISIVLDNVVTKGDADIEVTGQSITSALGNETINFDSSVTLTGSDITASLDNVTIEAAGQTQITGQQLTNFLGNVEQISTVDVFPTGIELTNSLCNDFSPAWRIYWSGTGIYIVPDKTITISYCRSQPKTIESCSNICKCRY